VSEALRFEGVAIRLGGNPVLRGVDLTVHAGEVVERMRRGVRTAC